MNYNLPLQITLDKESKQQKINTISPKIKICSQNKTDNNRQQNQDSAIFQKYEKQRSNSHNKQQINEERTIQRDVSAKNILNQIQEISDDKKQQKPVSNEKCKFKIYELKHDNYLTDIFVQPQNNQLKEDIQKLNDVKQKQEEQKQIEQNIKQLQQLDRKECNCKQKTQEIQNKNQEYEQLIMKLQKQIKESKKQQELSDQQKHQLSIQITQIKNEYQQIVIQNNKLIQDINRNESINQSQNYYQNIINQQKIQIGQLISKIQDQQKEIDFQNDQFIQQQQLWFLNEELQSNILNQDQKITELQQQIQILLKDKQKVQIKINDMEQQNQEYNNKINQQTFQINKLQCNQQSLEQVNFELIQQIEHLNLQMQAKQQQKIPPPIIQEGYRYNKIKLRLIDCEIQKDNLQILLENNGLKNIKLKFIVKELIEYQIQNESLLIQGDEHSYQIIRNQNESYALKGQGFQKPFMSKESAAQLLLPFLISNFILMDFYNQLQIMKQKQHADQIPSFEFAVPIILQEENSDQYWIAERQYHGERKYYNSKEGRIFLTDNDNANHFMTAFSFYTYYTTFGNYTILDIVSAGKFLMEPSICNKNSGTPAAFLANFQQMKIGYEFLDQLGIEYLK